MKKNHSIVCLVLAFFTFASIVSAQPASSRGEQLLPISYDEGMRRAKSGLIAEGFAVVIEGGAFIIGQKSIHTAVIMCNVAPAEKLWVNIVVASNHTDGGVPGAERVRLQKRMDQNYVSGILTGEWNIKCCGDELGWTLNIMNQEGTNFSGSFSDTHGGGAVNGQLRGNTIEFVRSGGWGKQQWTAQLVNDGGGLRMVNGTWTGDYVDRYPGRNNWHAEKK